MDLRRFRVPFDPDYFERLARGGVRYSVEEAFAHIHRTGHWAGPRHPSGEGATDEQTAHLRGILPALLRRLNVRSLLDLPCGDYGWMRHVPLPVEHYIGADILPILIDANQKSFGDERHHFVVLDLTSDVPPAADALLCRDCLVHLSFADTARALANIQRSNVRFLLTTTFPLTVENEDIITGDWRPINLQRPPFDFPPPEELVNEHCTEAGGSFADKSLGVWDLHAWS